MFKKSIAPPYQKSGPMFTPVSGGVVEHYNPKHKTYRVSVDGGATHYMRAMRSGADKPYPEGTKVVVVHSTSLSWLILGEVDPVSPMSGGFNEFADEDAADQGLQGGGLLYDPTPALSFRPVDQQGRPEPPLFAGDAMLSNRRSVRGFLALSYVRILHFGDVVVNASRACYTIYSRQRALIRTLCRNYIFTASGYEETIQTDTADDTSTTFGRTNRTEVVTGAPLSEGPADKVTQQGFIRRLISDRVDLLGVSVASRGERVTRGAFGVEECDLDTQTVRGSFVLGDRAIDYQVGSFAAENAPHPVTNVQNPSKAGPVVDADGNTVENGIHMFMAGDFRVIYDSDRGALTVRGASDEAVSMTKTQIALKKSGQSLTITGSGIAVKGSSFTVDCGGTVMELGANMTVTTGNFELGATTVNFKKA